MEVAAINMGYGAANPVVFPPFITAVLFSLKLRSAIMESGELSPRDRL
jgi:hypothetical protein